MQEGPGFVQIGERNPSIAQSLGYRNVPESYDHTQEGPGFVEIKRVNSRRNLNAALREEDLRHAINF